MPARSWFWWLTLPLAALGSERPATETSYRLGPGDVIEIRVFEVEELSQPAVLAPDGTAALPLLGPVELAGLTASQAAGRLRTLYGGSLLRDPQISVTVREYHSRPVTVLGAVAKPGVYTLRSPSRLSDVIALASGLAADAGSTITVTRAAASGDASILSIATGGWLDGGSGGDRNPWIEAGDTVRVAKAGVVYVVGEVGRSGGFPLPHAGPFTVLRALSLAEGLRRTAAPQQARILREAGAGRREIPVRLADLLAGRAPDAALEPGDILFVPNSRAKGALARSAEAAIQMATGVVIWRR